MHRVIGRKIAAQLGTAVGCTVGKFRSVGNGKATVREPYVLYVAVFDSLYVRELRTS